MNNNFDKILNELSYRVSTGIPDLSNEQHLIKLWDILKEHNWSIDARVELLKNLSNQDLSKPSLVVEALMKQQEIYKDGGKYAVMLLNFIEKQERLKTDTGDMIVLAKSNLNSKGIGGKDTLKDVLKSPTEDNIMTWFGDGLTRAPLTLKDTNGKMYNLNNIDKGKFSGKEVGGSGKVDAANYEMGICIAHAMYNNGMSYKQALSATGIDKSKYEKYREAVEPVGELVAKNISSYPLLSHSGAGKASVVNPYTNATPKTDIFGGASHRISLKQEGGAQLMSGGAADTKGVFVGAKTFWSKYEPGEMDTLLSEVIDTIDTDFKKISGDNTVSKIKEKFGEYYIGFRMPVVQKEVNDLITKLSKDKKKNAKDIKELQKRSIEKHIKLELSSLGLGRGSTDPKYIIPGVSQVKPNKVSSEFNNFFKTYNNEEAREEARKVLEHSMDIKSTLKPKFDKLWENDIFKKWVVYEAASGNYKFSGNDNLDSGEAAMANRILQFNSSGKIKDVMITPDWAKGYSSKVKSTVGYKTAGKTKATAFRLMTEQGVKNPEKYNSLFEYEMEQILNTEQVKLNEGINKIIEQSELLQEGFFDNLVKKGKSLVSKLKRVLTTLMNKIKNFLKKYFVDVAKKAIAKVKEYAQKGFNFFVEALGIEIKGSATVGSISL
jgi:hypothetical protein